MDIGQLRTDVIAGIDGLVVDDLTVTGYTDLVVDAVLPAAYASFPTELHDFSMTGTCIAEITVTVYVSRADETVAQTVLSQILSAVLTLPLPAGTSIAESALVNVDNIRGATFAGTECLAADINLSIRTN